MRAVILAGGRGTRLAPFTTVIPKPLLPVGDMPILEILLRQLAHYGFTRATLSLGYMAEYFKLFFAHRRSLRDLLEIDFVQEENPTGTAGSLAAITDLNDTFLVINGDVLTNLDYRLLLEEHRRSRSLLTIAIQNKQVKIDLGVLETDAEGAVTDYKEKPRLDYRISMGIYVYEPQVLQHIHPDTYLDFPDLVLKLLRARQRVNTYPNDACWLDLGRIEDLHRATEVFQARKEEFLPGAAAPAKLPGKAWRPAA